jgi:hypothetical protein
MLFAENSTPIAAEVWARFIEYLFRLRQDIDVSHTNDDLHFLRQKTTLCQKTWH